MSAPKHRSWKCGIEGEETVPEGAVIPIPTPWKKEGALRDKRQSEGSQERDSGLQPGSTTNQLHEHEHRLTLEPVQESIHSGDLTTRSLSAFARC